MRKNKLLFLAGGVNLILIIAAANLLLGALPKVKLDVTQDQIFSLSKTTAETVRNLDDIVNIKVYATRDLPAQVKPVADNLKTILDEVARINPRRLRVNYYDPSKSPEIKAEAEDAGIQPLQFNVLKSDKFEISNGYLGLVMIYGDKREVLPIAGDVGNLEYFLISGIKKLTGKEQMMVAISENQGAGQSRYQIFRNFIGRMYQTEEVDIGGSAPLSDKIKVWLVLGNEVSLNDGSKQRLREWMEKGKGFLVLDDRYKVSEMMEAREIPETGMAEVLKPAGITVEPKLILDESSSIASFQTSGGNFLTQYLFWPQILAENIDHSLPPLSSISSISLAWVSPLKLEGGARAMFKTSKNSIEEAQINSLSPLNHKTPEGEKQQYVAGAINMEQKRVAVVGDADWLNDQILPNNQQNLVTALNLIDFLGADESLIKIRSKTIKNYPIGSVPEEVKAAIRAANLAAPVVILAVIGLTVYFKRRHYGRRYES